MSHPRTIKSLNKKELSKQFNQKLAILKRIRFLPKPTPETIYHKTIFPSVLYGIAIWGSCSPALTKDIEHIHMSATKLVKNLPRDEIVQLRDWHPISYFYAKGLLVLAHKACYGNDIEVLKSLVENVPPPYQFQEISEYP